jgi:hypothetical protein
MTPTARSLAHLRGLGYVVEVVERWIPGANIRRDLFGFGDLLAVRPGEVLLVQTTTGDHVAHRLAKIAASPLAATVRGAGIRIVVHGWRKNAAGRWTLREVECSAAAPLEYCKAM